MSDLVTVIIPVYNASPELLERAVASAETQDADKEVLVVNDGSEEQLARAYCEIVGKYPSARLINKQNGGVSSARNSGLDEAHGEWVGFLDADDILTEGYLAEALGVLERSGADAVHGGYWYEFTSGSRVFYGQDALAAGEYRLLGGDDLDYLKASLFDKDALASLGLASTSYCSSCCSLFRRERAAGLRFDETLTISEDRLFNYRFWERAGSVALAGGCWYRYMENGESASHRLRPQAKEELLRTASAFEGLANDSSDTVRGSIWEGVVECYQQTLWFTILHTGFRGAMGMSATRFVRSLMAEPVYQRAFEHVEPVGFKQRLQKLLFQRGLAGLTVACFKLNGLLFDLKCRVAKNNKAEANPASSGGAQ